MLEKITELREKLEHFTKSFLENLKVFLKNMESYINNIMKHFRNNDYDKIINRMNYNIKLKKRRLLYKRRLAKYGKA